MALPDNARIRIIIAGFSTARNSSIAFRHYGRAYVVAHFRACCKDGRRTGARLGREGGRVIIIITAYNIRISELDFPCFTAPEHNDPLRTCRA